MVKKYISSRFPALTSFDFRLFWASQFISNIGSQMQFVALNWQIYELTHSAFALGLIGFIRFVPILIFSLIGGSVADAHNRKKILVITQSTLIFLSLILAITTFTKTINVSIIYIITALSAAALSFDLPARQALLPNLIDRTNLRNAISLNSIMFQTATILGPTISGLLIAHSGLATIYTINAFSFLFVIGSLFLISAKGQTEGVIPTKISFSSVIEGMAYVRSKKIIWSTMILDFFSTFFSSATALLPIFAKDILRVGPTGLGLLYAASSIGAVIAGAFIAHKHNLRHQGIILLSSIALYASGTIAFGFSKIFILSFFALFIIGMGDSISMIIRNTVRQLETPDYIRGRMTSINMIFAMGGPQLGDFEAGILASIAGGPLAVITGGIGTLIVVGIMSLTIPALRLYDRHKS